MVIPVLTGQNSLKTMPTKLKRDQNLIHGKYSGKSQDCLRGSWQPVSHSWGRLELCKADFKPTLALSTDRVLKNKLILQTKPKIRRPHVTHAEGGFQRVCARQLFLGVDFCVNLWQGQLTKEGQVKGLVQAETLKHAHSTTIIRADLFWNVTALAPRENEQKMHSHMVSSMPSIESSIIILSFSVSVFL